MANVALTGIMEKMICKDKDYRYMATSDLLNELNKEAFKPDNELEIKLTNIIIQQHVRRAAVLALSTFAHNKPKIIKGLLPDLSPLLYDKTIVKKELIRVVDLGPFKHTVHDGLELRKAAFECVNTLMDSCLDQVNHSSFIVPYHRSVLDSLVDPLYKTIDFKPKQDAVKQEVDHNEDMIRSAVRAIRSLNFISGDSSVKFKTLMNEISKSKPLLEKYNAIS